MNTETLARGKAAGDFRYFHPVGLTALVELKEALHKQNYERCAEIIAIAREFGAQKNEVQNILNYYA